MAEDPLLLGLAGGEKAISWQATLLKPKLCVPKASPTLVLRPQLAERLNEVVNYKLTLLSAPAGFGKTTLLLQWLSTPPGSQLPVAWVELDGGDNDRARFLNYMIAAIQTLYPDVGKSSLQPRRELGGTGKVVSQSEDSEKDVLHQVVGHHGVSRHAVTPPVHLLLVTLEQHAEGVEIPTSHLEHELHVGTRIVHRSPALLRDGQRTGSTNSGTTMMMWAVGLPASNT